MPYNVQTSYTSQAQSQSATETIIDGVHRLNPTGISILVVGGGCGGLMFAIEAWRQGHDVQVLEKSKEFSSIGVGHDGNPALGLAHIASLHKDYEANSYDALLTFYSHTGEKVMEDGEASWNEPGAVHPARDVRVAWLVRRFSFVAAVEAQARRLGIPVHYGKNVIKYDEDETKGFVDTSTGDRYYADLIVAADGVGTKSHGHITGKALTPSSSGYAVFRAVIPMERLANVSQTAKEKILTNSRPSFRMYLGPDMHINVIIAPDSVTYVMTHTDSGAAEESWRSTVSAGAVLDTMKTIPGWDPALLEIIAQTPENSIVDWKLLWRNPQPKWCGEGGRVLQLGDAAHSFLPTSGNGATQAMEDALSLATCLRLGGKDKIPESVKAHVILRYERVSILQRFGFANRQVLHHLDPFNLKTQPELMEMKHGKWMWGHNPIKYAKDNYHKAVSAAVEGTTFVNTNIPPGFEYTPWTIEEELEREKKGLKSQLRETGDWN